MPDDDPDEPGVDVTDLLVAAYQRGRRDAFTEGAELLEMAHELLAVPEVVAGARVAFDIAFRTLSLMLRRRADPDVKAGADV